MNKTLVFAALLALVCMLTIGSADPMKIEIGATGSAGAAGSGPVNAAAGGDVNKLIEDDDDEDFFDSAAMARHAEMLKENQKKAAEADAAGASAAAEPALPEGPIRPAQETYEWSDSDLTSAVWRAVNDGSLDSLKRIVRYNNDAVHVRSKDGRGALWWAYEYGKTDIIDQLLAWGASATERDATGKTPAQLAA